ncbi:hypothetical protein AB833_29140 [Chromatiales bacterium (ex Bugula neritina AB1)]|nr:hypothetical protein AB833_29140 [Chromatiales bacterium (ex Bugula neritina AB1)]
MNPVQMDKELISKLFATGTYSSKWPPLLDQLHPLCNAKGAGLVVVENVPDAKGRTHHFNCLSTSFDSDIQSYYADNYSHHEVDHIKLVFEGRVGEVITDPAFDDIEAISQRPDVAYLIEYMDIFDRFGVRLNDDKAWSDAIAFQYGPERSNVTPEEYARVQPYMHHIGQAIAMGRIYDSIRSRYQAVLSMLDRVNVGMLLLRSDGAIVICNRFAQQVIDESSRLTISSSGYFVATNRNESAELKQKIDGLSEEATSASKQYVRLGGDLENNDLVIELSRLLDDEGDVGNGFEGVIAILVDPNRPFQLGMDALSVYSLTASESELANLIANGLDYKAAAEHRGVGHETIKTQARSLMRKMRADSRAGIVRRLLSLGLPFVD